MLMLALANVLNILRLLLKHKHYTTMSFLDVNYKDKSSMTH